MFLRPLIVAISALLAAAPNVAVEAQRNDQAIFALFDEIAVSIQSDQVSGRDPFALGLEQTESVLVAPLNLLLASHIASFPLTSVISLHDVFVRVGPEAPKGAIYARRKPLGPLFAETARTLRRGNFDFGFTVSAFSVSRLRGRYLNDLQFNFVDRKKELETLEVALDIEAAVQLFVVLGAFSPLPRLDFGVALPVVRVDLRVQGRAQLSQNARTDSHGALFFFNDDALKPVLNHDVETDPDPVTGIGDVSLRLKYELGDVIPGLGRTHVNTAILLDVRLPTGERADFLGTGHPSVKFLFVADSERSPFAPHLNLGYQYRGAENDSDEIELVVGLDLQLTNSTDLILDLVADFDLSRNEPLDRLTELESVTFAELRRSNIPQRGRDHSMLLSSGMKFAPSEHLTFAANILAPLSPDHGLTYRLAPTVGLFVNF